jgi:hypothetical protein
VVNLKYSSFECEDGVHNTTAYVEDRVDNLSEWEESLHGYHTPGPTSPMTTTVSACNQLNYIARLSDWSYLDHVFGYRASGYLHAFQISALGQTFPHKLYFNISKARHP